MDRFRLWLRRLATRGDGLRRFAEVVDAPCARRLCWGVPLFARDQSLELRLRGVNVAGRLVYELEDEMCVRVKPEELEKERPALLTGLPATIAEWRKQADLWREQLDGVREFFSGRSVVRGGYRQGQYDCSFETRLLKMVPDRSCRDGTVILTLEIPKHVKRVYAGRPRAALAGPA